MASLIKIYDDNNPNNDYYKIYTFSSEISADNENISILYYAPSADAYGLTVNNNSSNQASSELNLDGYDYTLSKIAANQFNLTDYNLPENTVVMVMNRNYDGVCNFAETTNQFISEISERNNVNYRVSDSNYFCFSNGVRHAPKNVNALIDAGIPISNIVCIDLTSSEEFSEETISNLNNHNTNVVLVASSDSNPNMTTTKSDNMFQGIINKFTIRFNKKNHLQSVFEIMNNENGLLHHLLFGTDLKFENENENNVIYSYNTDGNWEKDKTEQEFIEKLSNYSDKDELEEKNQNTSEQTEITDKFAHFIISDSNNQSEEGRILSSNLNLVVDKLNAIYRDNNKTFNKNQILFDKSNNLFTNNILNAQNFYFAMGDTIGNAINYETRNIYGMAKKINTLDINLAKEALNLNKNIEVIKSMLSEELFNTLDLQFSDKNSINKYLHDPSALVIGQIGNINSNELRSLINGNMLAGALHENFQNDITICNNTIKSLDSLKLLIDNSTLQGAAWQEISHQLNSYEEILTYRIQAANLLEKEMNRALNLIIDYMENYTDLDDSKVEEIENKIRQITEDINDLKFQINETIEEIEEKTLPFGIKVTTRHNVFKYNEETRAKMRQTIKEKEKDLAEFKKYLKKIKGLPEVIKKSEKIINEAMIEAYNLLGQKISDLTN